MRIPRVRFAGFGNDLSGQSVPVLISGASDRWNRDLRFLMA